MYCISTLHLSPIFKSPSDYAYDLLCPAEPSVPQAMYPLVLGGKLTAADLNASKRPDQYPPALSLISTTHATTIGSIQGSTFLSAYDGQTLTNITGLVTAKVWNHGTYLLPLSKLISSKGPAEFWLAGEKTDDETVSTGIMVFAPSSLSSVRVGDMISLDAKVFEYQLQPTDLHLTELISPTNITVLSSGNPVVPILLGRDRSPPTQYLSSLDSGPDGFSSVPGNRSLQDTPDRQLQPASYGLDFWESLEGQVVTIPRPISLGFGNNFRYFWARGSWNATGVNSRGGLSITFGAYISPPCKLVCLHYS